PVPGCVVRTGVGWTGAGGAGGGRHRPAHAAVATGGELRQQLRAARFHAAADARRPRRGDAAGLAGGWRGGRAFPAPDASHRYLTPMLQDLRHLATGTPRVLVVDGSRVVRMLVKAVLEKELPGVEVVGAGGLDEAMSALAAAPVDL